MKKTISFQLFTIVAVFAVISFGCNENEPIALPEKSTTNENDSLFCLRIIDFIEDMNNQNSNSINFDSAEYYLESSINFNYGNSFKEYGASLSDSFDVELTMTQDGFTNYSNLFDTRTEILDSLKSTYDRINEDSAFIIYVCITPGDISSSTAQLKISYSFGWGEYVEFDRDEPLRSGSYHWQTEAPAVIVNTAKALYVHYPSVHYGFFKDFEDRRYSFNENAHNWQVRRSEITPASWIGMNLCNPNYSLNFNYMEFYSFYQEHYSFNPPIGLHEYLSNGEMNFYTLAIKSAIIQHSSGYGDPSNSIGGVPFKLVDIQITPITVINSQTQEWKYYYHYQYHIWGRSVIQCIDPIYHLEIADFLP